MHNTDANGNTAFFAENLRTLRKVLGFVIKGDTLSQTEFAELLGVTRRTLVYWEKNETPNKNHRIKILDIIHKYLKIEVDENFLQTKDISKAIGPVSFFMYSDMLTGLSQKKRQLLQHLFMKLEHADADTLNKVLEIVDGIIEE